MKKSFNLLIFTILWSSMAVAAGPIYREIGIIVMPKATSYSNYIKTASGAPNSENLTISTGGTTNGYSGAVYINPGTASGDTTGGVEISGGTGNAGIGGINLLGGYDSGNAGGGQINIYGGNSASGAGGALDFQAGQSYGTNTGGDVAIYGGATGTNGNSGGVTLGTTNATGTGASGNITATTGAVASGIRGKFIMNVASLDIPSFISMPTTTSVAGIIKQNGAVIFNTIGTENLFLGESAGNFTVSGVDNLGIGSNALHGVTSGYSNMAIGPYALGGGVLSGITNAAIGVSALRNVSSGGNNTCIGYACGQWITTGSYNSGIGDNALNAGNQTGTTAIGSYSIVQSTGDENTGLGFQAGRYISTGPGNTMLGAYAGHNATASGVDLTTGSYNTFIGWGAGSTVNSIVRATAVGSLSRVGRDDAINLGGVAATRVGIGIISNPNATLDVPGDINLVEMAAPSLASGANFKMYAATDHRVYGSINGGAFAQIFPASGASGSGTVTEVALTVPSILVTTSPVTTSGTLAVTLATQTANKVFAGPTSGGAATPTFRTLVTADLPSAVDKIDISINGGGDVVTTGIIAGGDWRAPYAMTITGWYLMADQTCSMVVDVWKQPGFTSYPTVSNTITGSEKPTLSSALMNSDTNLTTWTGLAVASGDILRFNVDSATTCTFASLQLVGTRP